MGDPMDWSKASDVIRRNCGEGYLRVWDRVSARLEQISTGPWFMAA